MQRIVDAFDERGEEGGLVHGEVRFPVDHRVRVPLTAADVPLEDDGARGPEVIEVARVGPRRRAGKIERKLILGVRVLMHLLRSTLGTVDIGCSYSHGRRQRLLSAHKFEVSIWTVHGWNLRDRSFLCQLSSRSLDVFRLTSDVISHVSVVPSALEH